jgi:hypothetical protein
VEKIILWPFGIFNGHFGFVLATGYIFYSFGVMDQEKSGSPENENYSPRMVRVATPPFRSDSDLFIVTDQFRR